MAAPCWGPLTKGPPRGGRSKNDTKPCAGAEDKASAQTRLVVSSRGEETPRRGSQPCPNRAAARRLRVCGRVAGRGPPPEAGSSEGVSAPVQITCSEMLNRERRDPPAAGPGRRRAAALPPRSLGTRSRRGSSRLLGKVRRCFAQYLQTRTWPLKAEHRPLSHHLPGSLGCPQPLPVLPLPLPGQRLT